MANTITGFLERLTAAAGDFNKAKVGTLGALDAVYLDIRPEVARMGQTIRVYFPDMTPFTDQAANDWAPEDVNPNYVDVPFGQRPGKAILIRDFEQFQTSTDIIDQFIDPNFKRACEYANGSIFSLLNTTNFGTYGAIATVPTEVDVSSARLAWNLLTRNKVPVQDDTNSTILYHPDVHANTLTDPQWSQENLVSAVIAQTTRQDAAQPGADRIFPIQGNGPEAAANKAFKFNRRFDQQAPVSTSVLTGTVTVTNGSTTVTGSGTSFLSQVAAAPVTGAVQNVGWVNFGSSSSVYDTTGGAGNGFYPVASVSSNTAMTLAMPYGGSLSSTGNLVQRQTYTGVAMHRYAIALAVRPLEIVNDGHVRSRLMMIKGLPMRLMLSYQHLKAGWLMTLDYGMVAKVIRPDFGVLLNS